MTLSMEDCKALIERFFQTLGMDADANRNSIQDGLSWQLHRGTAVIFLDLLQNGENISFRVFSPVLFLPNENILPFYRRLLEINMNLVGCAFGVYADKVAVIGERPTKGLDFEEIETMIHYITAIADEFDNLLADEFGATLFKDRPA